MLSNLFQNFMGDSPDWYKRTIIAFLIINPILFYTHPSVAGWVLLIEFIFTLTMSLACYPLIPGGLLALQAVAIGMTSPEHVMKEFEANIEVITLLMFMVAGIYFAKDVLYNLFARLIVTIKSKTQLSIVLFISAAMMSAFLDALTVIAVLISVAVGFYGLYEKHAGILNKDELEQFKGFLRNLLMHAGVGTAAGGVFTMVGEPQNLIIANKMGWTFSEFALNMLHISLPTFITGITVCFFLEKFKATLFGFGFQIPTHMRDKIKENLNESKEKRSAQETLKLHAQTIVLFMLVGSLATHIAPVGLLGLGLIILTSTLTGVTSEKEIGKAFEEALPFTALLTVFFAIVAVIIDLQVFKPIIDYAATLSGQDQRAFFYIANGLLSAVSDNVFVGTIYINEVSSMLEHGVIDVEQASQLAMAVNAGTNIPSVSTPNGQAAFLFLLTSAIAAKISLSYMSMVRMAFPYAILMTTISFMASMM